MLSDIESDELKSDLDDGDIYATLPGEDSEVSPDSNDDSIYEIQF